MRALALPSGTLTWGWRNWPGPMKRPIRGPRGKPRNHRSVLMESVIPIPAPTVIPVNGCSAVFPVRRIYCVGRNYADHAREMGMDPNREPPFFFGKPHDVVVPCGGDIAYPPATSNLHYEVELVVAIAKGGQDIPMSEALSCIYGFAVGIDLTRRDLQAKSK